MIVCKSTTELETMHRAGLIVWEVLNELRMMVAPGVTTQELDQIAERRTTEHNARPAFKGYRGYPASLCASINEEVVHGIPSASRGSCGKEKSFHSILELSWTVIMAMPLSPFRWATLGRRWRTLLRVTRESLDRAN